MGRAGWLGVAGRVAKVAGFLGGGLAAAALGVGAAFWLSPWPGALLIRKVFRDNDRTITAALRRHTPPDVTSVTNLNYAVGDDDAYLDVHLPGVAHRNGSRLPLVVWTHGGAWVAGEREAWTPYFKVLASKGFAVAAISYSLGPKRIYPAALLQLDAALSYLRDNASRLQIDPERIVLAGDSAGAQITSQYAALATNPAARAAASLTPSLPAECLRGLILHCGIYDFGTYFTAKGLIGWGTRASIRAYTGSRGTTAAANPALGAMSTIDHLTSAYPPTFISGGNGDPLTDKQSRPMAAELERLGVRVTSLFFPPHHEPALPHEYQFDLDSAEGQQALSASVAFLEEVFAGGSPGGRSSANSHIAPGNPPS